MNRHECESDPMDTFDMGYHLHAKEQHRQRVAKNGDRIEYVIKQFEENGIEYALKNESNGHFHCRRKSDDSLVQFWAGTGKIMGRTDIRGIHALISYLLS